ncbi:MAG TPA: ABC transporter substrate-binding protein [Spirochaetota bacterium]|nr:ABC transporter substrate-binding protein [Spirochaetota bacterium]
MQKLIAVIFSLMLLAFFGCGKEKNIIRKGENIKIGFIGPMTGDPGNYGKVMSQSIQIAVDEFNAEGGAHDFKAELVIEDAGTDAEKGIAAMKRLAYDDNIFGLVGACYSTVSLAIAPIAEASKILMISPASTHKDLPDKGKFIFRNIMNDALQAVVFAKYLYEVDKVKNVAILYLETDYSRTLAMDFKAQYEKDGGKVVAVESGHYGDKDFMRQLKKIKSHKPESLYLPNYPAETAVILEQMQQLGFKTRIYSADSFANSQFFETSSDLTEGVIYTQMAEQPESSSLKNFKAEYHAKWGIKPDALNLDDIKVFYNGSVYWGAKPNRFSFNAYDGAKIILNAIRGASVKGPNGSLKIDRDKVREIVAKTKDYDGASGKITFTPNGDLVCNVGIYTVQNKKYIQLKVYKLDGDKLVRIK